MFLHDLRSSSLTLLAVVALSSLLQQARADDGMEFHTRPILDGRLATTADLHATVALVDPQDGETFCTGTLIAPRVVVTAAHCVVQQDEDTDAIIAYQPPSAMRVVAGALNADRANTSQTYALDAIVVHPGYPNHASSSHASGAGRYDDVALLILARAVTALRPALVPTEGDIAANMTAGKLMTISGYGTTSAAGAGGGVLYIAETVFGLKLNVEIVLGARGRPDTCPGDSGGPAYVLRGDDALLAGITSRSSADSSAACGDTGIYGFAPAYRSWFVQSSGGLYSVSGMPTDPTPPDPTDPTPPDPTDPTPSCDPNVEDCDDICDTDDEDCYCDWFDEDCDDSGCAAAGGGSSALGLMVGGALLVLVVRRRRALQSR